MSGASIDDNTRNFTLSTDIFFEPNLDIYAQMVYIVMKSYVAEASLPTVDEVARQGRMQSGQAVKALQRLADHKLLPHKVFRHMVGEFADNRLSWAAKGLLAYLANHPQIKLSELQELSNQSGEDEQSIRKALRDLHRYGYLEEYPELRKLAN
ncbi:hypothetical protein SD70_04080 [Gordoniibacillus kamchatkensis]|uniref:Uncharacterized protein n=1 Tax=Gordoniibacillus kamchatkensis TaxID=1590651 RepID=A0ABR5ALG6_9BACL|nr:hypothetical protein [Paenibacillus sp. VKM B-2647]KIL41810.1 hypothetical protein SD70_04080 [Paenibacillus sp. VKM B-2647]